MAAAECLDFSIPCPSIFTRDRPLADATMRRIAKGVMRHVINSADPFIVPATHQGGDRVHDVRDPMRTITAANRGELMLAAPELAPFLTEHANASRQRTMAADEPLPTVCAGVKGGHFSVVSPTLVQTGYGEREGQAPHALDLQQPLGTIVAGGVKHAVAAPHLVKFRGDSIGTPATEPMPTITSGAGAVRPTGAAHALGVATAFLEQANGGFYQGVGNDARDPVSTITASGSQQRLVSADLVKLSPSQEAGALRVAAFLVKYYGSGIAVGLHDPVDTVTTKDRLALVTVIIKGTPYVIVDIGLRMLKPHELFRAQGFPATYIIDRTADGTVLKITAQVRMCGNSVSPPPFYALIDANLDPVMMPLAEVA
ncbi:MAG: DNA cytosine methyltransferase [Pseudomonadales bacterium]